MAFLSCVVVRRFARFWMNVSGVSGCFFPWFILYVLNWFWNCWNSPLVMVGVGLALVFRSWKVAARVFVVSDAPMSRAALRVSGLLLLTYFPWRLM